MVTSSLKFSSRQFPPLPRYPSVRVEHFRSLALFCSFFVLAVSASGQNSSSSNVAEEVVVVGGVSDSTVFGVGKTLKITGTVKQGAIAFGGDVIVEGNVDGDVAAIGGSVIQADGARIGGDVIVLGGTYRHGDKPPNRNASSMTMMYAGYQQEIRDLMRNPTDMLKPQWSPRYIGIRILAILFWFIVSLAFTAALPGSISRGVARLQLTSLRVAVIGVIGAIVMGAGSFISLWILPETLSALIGLLALMLLLVAGLFGRVILYAATGRWLQRKYVPIAKDSEAVALLLGCGFWVLLTSLPYVWPFVVSFIWVISLGLALTARYRVGWNQVQNRRHPAF